MKKQDFVKIVTFDNTEHVANNLYTLYQIFMAEKGYHSGLTLASVEEYLRGLPSCLSFPFYDFDILEKTGLQPRNYWTKLSKYVYSLILESKQDLVGIISNIDRVDTSFYGNPRYSFILDTANESVLLQTQSNDSLGYSIQNYNNKKAIVSTRFYHNKLCATNVKVV